MARRIVRALLAAALYLLWSAAAASAGWYLMEPPSVQTPGNRLYLAAPLWGWAVLESFDRASDCEKARSEGPRGGDGVGRAERYPVCLATDDPRLADGYRNNAIPLVPNSFWFVQVPLRLYRCARPARTLGR
jgi:hypothetical protein